MSLNWIKQRRFPTYEEFCEGFEAFKRNARMCREKQKTKMNLPNYKLKGAYSKDEFTDIKFLRQMQPVFAHFSARTKESVPKVFLLAFISHPKGLHLSRRFL